VIVGAGDPFAEAVHRELTRRRRQVGEPALAPPAAEGYVERLPVPAGSTLVCGRDPDAVLRIGLNLLLAGHPDVVLRLERRAVLAGALEQRLFDRVLGRLSVFGVLVAACDLQRLTRNP
jgi:hypothetical protein